MKSYQDDGKTNWFNIFKNDDKDSWFKNISNLFDYKKFTGFLNSGGGGASNNHDDDDDNNHDDDDDNNHDDDDDNNHDDDDDVDQTPIKSASVAFNIEKKHIDVDDKPILQNVVDQCIFHSAESFEPLCIRCKFLDEYGKVIAKGELIDPKSSYIASSPQTITMYPVTATPASNDVQDVEKVKLEICGFKKKSGFFVGGGRVNVPKNGGGTYTLTHGFELHCDPTLGPNNLEINWMKNKFHLEELEEAECIDDGTTNEPPPSPHPGPTLDIYTGEGFGRYNGVCGAFAKWSMVDNGEPGKNDQILSLLIKDKKDGNVVLNIGSKALNLKTGNHQWVPHPSTHPNPPIHTTPCPEETP